MPTTTAPRRIAAALTAVFVACALIALGGASHGTAPSQRLVIGQSHVGSSIPTAHLGSTTGKHHVASHPDLVSTPPSTDQVAPAGSMHVAASTYATRVERDLAAPTGRGPPAL